MEDALLDNFDKTKMPLWANQICSLDKSHVVKHFAILNGNTKIVEINVTAYPYDLLRTEFKIPDVTILMIDTEGADFQILRQIPLRSNRPGLFQS